MMAEQPWWTKKDQHEGETNPELRCPEEHYEFMVMEEFYHPKTVWVPLGILLGSGTLFAVLTLQWQCCFVTFSTATFGSAIITVTVDYFIELFALVHYIYERLRVAPKKPVCWFTWVILGVWPVLAFLGVLIQWKVTAEGFSHTEGVCGAGEGMREAGVGMWGSGKVERKKKGSQLLDSGNGKLKRFH
ncbi:transmembrane protein 198-B-like protein [Lates japonicus]|uniref:Transmembrane protein 198 n=1 Tax=Lates japonicus TaxID=270547 RepID=A0AAD3R2C6_LATJO|nr:transmembrane protein 198-B-like protein [Lates japonicus]